ncbi:MAG: hypothetical protein RIS35_12 [Pseudomonadota bacterium]|jgi:deoxyribodipyrimidine photo-lyase
MPLNTSTLVWFRRDLRSTDHAALAAALEDSDAVWCVFVFDREILDALKEAPGRPKLPSPPQGAGWAKPGPGGALKGPADRRVEFIHDCVVALDASLRAQGGGLIVLHDRARDAIPRLAAELGVDAVYANRDYEPHAVARDAAVSAALEAQGRSWRSFKDQVILEQSEVLTGGGKPFSVFTPYRNAWLKRVSEADLAERRVIPAGRLRGPEIPSGAFAGHGSARPAPRAPEESAGRSGDRPGSPDAIETREGLAADPSNRPAPAGAQLPSLESLGFERTNLGILGITGGEASARALFDQFCERIGRYREARDYPALRGPSYLSVHLRFGTIPIRALARRAREIALADPGAAEGANTWLSELIWRDFYFQILHHHPRVVDRAFRPEYDRIAWETGERADRLFTAWCEGRTGYPLVDAAMAQINTSGYMHNRLRMVVASFLVKDLGIDWRRGEAYFAAKLNDFDLAANNGGWQWAASTGCDAQPWFRIFNPVTQSEKFDPQGRFIRRYLPQLANLSDKAIHAPWLAAPLELQAAGIRLGEHYPRPIVDHAQARERTLARYSVVKGPAAGAD